MRKYYMEAEKLRLNDGQWKAYESQGNAIVLAGPGSGKTKTLVTKVARMLHEDVREPRGLACVTFSNECARELERRLAAIEVTSHDNLFIGTVHTFCLQHIVIPYSRLGGLDIPEPFAIAKSIDRRDALGIALRRMGEGEDPESRLSSFSAQRRLYLGPQRDNSHLSPEDLQLIGEYEQALHRQGLIDFDDMVIAGLRLIEESPWVRDLLHARFPILVVDEYQDLGVALHQMVLKLCFDSDIRLFAVGDPDQSIYGFMGAQPNLLADLASRDDIERVHLRLNYRCGNKIVKASQIVLAEERDYTTPTDTHEGVIYFVSSDPDPEDQANHICTNILPEVIQQYPESNLGDIAILYPTKYYGDALSTALEAMELSYTRIDNNALYPKTRLTRWIEQCAYWCSGGWENAQPRLDDLMRLWLQWNKQINGSVRRETIQRQFSTFLWSHINPDTLVRGWLEDFNTACLISLFEQRGELTDEQEAFDKLLAACQPDKRFAEYSLQRFAGQRGTPDHLNLITLHSAKGCEFDHVILMGMDQGVLPRRNLSLKSKKEARRLFYVGITRAKRTVYLVCSKKTVNSRGYESAPSEFVLELYRRLQQES